MKAAARTATDSPMSGWSVRSRQGCNSTIRVTNRFVSTRRTLNPSRFGSIAELTAAASGLVRRAEPTTGTSDRTAGVCAANVSDDDAGRYEHEACN